VLHGTADSLNPSTAFNKHVVATRHELGESFSITSMSQAQCFLVCIEP
jgi:hypothetical protein